MVFVPHVANDVRDVASRPIPKSGAETTKHFNDGNNQGTVPMKFDRMALESTFRMYSDVFYWVKNSVVKENMEILDSLLEFRKNHSDTLKLNWLDKYIGNCRAVQSDVMDISIPKNRTITSYLENQNDCISFYLPGNNCLLMLENSNNENCKYMASAFTCHPTNKDVFLCDVCCMNYPEMSVPVLNANIPVLESKCFANQLTVLTESLEISSAKTKKKGTVVSEDREVSSPILITEWLLSLLSGDRANIRTHNICKKVRTFVRSSKEGTSRRSPFWISLKASIHYMFNKIYGDKQGKLLYKCFMLDFMNFLCTKANRYVNMNNDLLMQMAIKISLRMTKLDKLRNTVDMLENKAGLLDKLNNTISHAYVATKETKNHIQNRMNKTIEEMKITDKFNTNFPTTATNNTQNLNKSLQKVKDSKLLFEKKQLGLGNSNLPKEENDEISKMRKLMECENWVKIELFTIIEESKKEKSFSDTLFQKMDEYHEIASNFYTHDPVGKSRYIITMFGFLRAFHMIAISFSKLLEEYSTGVDISTFKYLLLEAPSDLKFVMELEQYFTHFDKKGKIPSDFLKNKFNSNSYCVMYVRHDKTMRQALDKIFKENEERKQQKLEDVRNAKLHYQRQHSKCCDMSCDYFINVHGYSRHHRWCKKCSLQQSLANMKLSIFEDFLPLDYIQQYAIVFELLIPNYYLNYRDAFFCIAQIQQRIQKSKDSIPSNWRYHPYLSDFASGREPKYATIGSTVRGFSDTHYSQLHVESSEERFLTPNGYDLVATVGIKNTFTMIPPTIDSKFFSFPTESPEYSSLDWAIYSFEHSQNQVMANQALCHQSLSLAEFVEFGSLRAGFRLQWHNIVRCLANEKLSIQRSDVTILLLQSMLQACPNESMKWYREVNEPLQNTLFCMKFLDLLESILDKYKENWRSHQVALILIMAALRVIGIYSGEDIVTEKYLEFLGNIRNLILKWSIDIESLIVSMFDSPSLEIAKIRQYLIDINCCSVLTFNLEPTILKSILNKTGNIEIWAKSVSRIHDNMVLSKQFTFPPSTLKGFLMRRYYQTTCVVQKYIGLPRTALTNFAKFYWEDCKNALSLDWKSHDYGWFSATMMTAAGFTTVAFNVVRGAFLVNGNPIGRLPDSITADEKYKRVFGNFIFDVKQGADSNSFVTSYDIDGCQLEFRRNLLMILRQKNEESILLSHKIFENDLPSQFVENYSHWYDNSTDCILFRPLSFFSPNFKSIIPYKLDIKGKCLQELSSGRNLVNYDGDLYTEVLKSISRIELKQNVHIFSKDNEILVELPRLGLHFELVDQKFLRSKEFSMVVCDSFYCGTLIGLSNAIMLKDENPHSTKKIILVPNGEIVTEQFNQHHLTRIDVTKALDTPYFTYTVNEYLWQLEANDSLSSWLFLALLHGTTTSVLPDPFTKLTGYESALKILKSARCWPMRPLSMLETKLLTTISASLSPDRTFHPPHIKVMEKVQWPKHLPSLGLLDAYKIVVDAIVNYCKQLDFLHNVGSNTNEVAENNMILTKRSYKSYSNYYNSVARIDSITDPKQEFTYLEFMKISSSSSLYNCKYLASISKNNYEKISAVEEIDTLDTFVPEKPVEQFIYNWKNIDLDTDFLTLYSMAKSQNPADFKIFTTYLGYIFPDKKKLLACVMIINLFADSFKTSPPLFFDLIDNLEEKDFDEDHATNLLKNSNSNLTFDDQEDHDRFDKDISTCIKFAMIAFKKGQMIETNRFGRLEIIDKVQAVTNLSNYLTTLYTRSHFSKFLGSVKTVLQNLMKSSTGNIILSSVNVNPLQNEPKECLNIQTIMRNQKQETKLDTFGLSTALEMSKYIFERGDIIPYSEKEEIVNLEHDIQLFLHDSKDPLYDEYITELENSYLRANNQPSQTFPNIKIILELKERLWNTLTSILTPLYNVTSLSLSECGISDRLCPSLFLEDLVSCRKTFKAYEDLIGAFAVLTTLEQRYNRLTLLKEDPNKKVQFERELENKGHTNWSPKKYPQWLLLEIELDLMIRPIQFEVANHMLSSSTNMVLQFNMGEGKTSVIIPMLVLALQGDQIPRLTILKQLLQTNYTYLSFKLGGMLNRNVLYMPFSRDLKISDNDLLTIQKVLNDMKINKSILITVPEYRLSFELKGIEKAIGKDSIAHKFLKLQEIFEQNCKDILDESDEILHVRYQLIYTVGEQKDLDMSNLRWLLPQKIMRIVQKHAEILSNKLGPSHVEYFTRGSSHSFPYFRILDKTSYHELVDLIVEDILEGRASDIFIPYKLPDRQNIKKILTAETISQKELDILSSISNDILRSEILLMRGIFAFGLLYHSLNKRWRVNYGVNPNINRLVAVPFRAKDCPSDRAEFGHPDIAILFTLLSYYYSGLTNQQLDVVFQYLQRIESPDVEYEKWVYEMKKIPESIKHYKSINLEDFVQKTQVLYPALRNNMAVIDFFLNRSVFSRECKQFDRKISASAWNLCKDTQYPTCGFSGTKAFLLPISIQENELPSLKGTTGELLKTLLSKENNEYHVINQGEITNFILDLNTNNQKVLIDVGALMIEMSNFALCKYWLNSVTEIVADAAVFFNKKDQLVVLDRNGLINPFEISPYKNKLERCLIYLDDIHTRGTDLKFPTGMKAAVTLGNGLTFERLCQACMRMRLLGKGHSVAFWASTEVDRFINGNFSQQLTIQERILKWTIHNRVQMENDHYLQWASSGLLFNAKKIAKQEYDKTHNMDQYAKQCTENELFKIGDFYGQERREQKLLSVFENRLFHISQLFSDDTNIYSSVAQIKENINKRAHSKTIFSQLLNEEQERELENELEEQRVVERPQKCDPAATSIDYSLEIFMKKGLLHADDEPLIEDSKTLPLSEALEDTILASPINWNHNIYVTDNYLKTITNTSVRSPFFKPVTWLAYSEYTQTIIILSPEEANYYINKLDIFSPTRLLMFSSRTTPNSRTMIDEPAWSVPNNNFQMVDKALQNLLTDIHIFSGSLYFGNEMEQEEFCKFIGMAPKPYAPNSMEEQLFQKSIIDEFGLISRYSLEGLPLLYKCRIFSVGVIRHLRKIISVRDKSCLFELSHLYNILIKNQKVNFK